MKMRLAVMSNRFRDQIGRWSFFLDQKLSSPINLSKFPWLLFELFSESFAQTFEAA